MDIKQEVSAAERVIRSSGTSLAQFCKCADIHPSTWREWRAGSLPQMGKWVKVQAALKSLASPKPAKRRAAR